MMSKLHYCYQRTVHATQFLVLLHIVFIEPENWSSNSPDLISVYCPAWGALQRSSEVRYLIRLLGSYMSGHNRLDEVIEQLLKY